MKRKASESLCISCFEAECDCANYPNCNPVIILETARASVPELQPHQTLLVEMDGFCQGMVGPGEFLSSDRRPEWGQDTTWEMMGSTLAVEHKRGLERACVSPQKRSWYRVGDLIVSVKKFCVDEEDAAFGYGAFTASVFDPGNLCDSHRVNRR